MSKPTRTKISPASVYELVRALPKSLQEEFRKEAYFDFVPEDVDFVPEPERRYDHSLGLSWLTSKGIPNTIEELEEQRQYLFQTVIAGPVTYNVGQFIVLFANTVYHPSEVADQLLVVEVMSELDFPELPDLTTPYTDEIRNASNNKVDMIALQQALSIYAAQGKIRIHEAGVRMYSVAEKYAFEDNFKPEAEGSIKGFAHQARRKN